MFSGVVICVVKPKSTVKLPRGPLGMLNAYDLSSLMSINYLCSLYRIISILFQIMPQPIFYESGKMCKLECVIIKIKRLL